METKTPLDRFYTDKRCAVCGKEFTIPHPTRWAYKTRKGLNTYIYFCSWKCLRAKEKRSKEKPEMTEEKNTRIRRDKREVLEGLIEVFEGECMPPVEYLKELGYRNPEDAWHEMKTWSKANAPDLYQRLVDHRLVKPQKRGGPTVTVTDKLPGDAQREPSKQTTPTEKVEMVYDPSIKEEYERDMAMREERGRLIAAGLDRAAAAREERLDGIVPLEPASLWSRVLPNGTFKKVTGMGMMLCGMNYQITLTAYEWFRLTEEILTAIRQLKADKLTEEPHEE